MQKYDSDMDRLLQKALSASDVPEEAVNNAVKKSIREMEPVDNLQKRSLGFAFVLLMGIMVMAVPGYALWQQFTAKEAAELLDYPLVAAAFEDENAVIIEESVVTGGHRVTLLGIVSGDNLIAVMDGQGDRDRTYAVLAVEKENGQMPATSSDDYVPFYATPLVKGEQPWQVNMHTLGGGSATFVEAGVQYMMIECDSIEMFADRGLYLAVMEGYFYNQEAFSYDLITGEVAVNTGFEGVNALFELPLDPAKGDPEKARRYLDTVLAPQEEEAVLPDIEGDYGIEATLEVFEVE